MSEDSDVSFNRTNKLLKRRRLNIEHVIDGDIAYLDQPCTPQSQQLPASADRSQSPSIVDLTGLSDDEYPIGSTRGFEELRSSGSDQDDVTFMSGRQLSHVQIPRRTVTNVAFTGWHPPETPIPEMDAITELSRDLAEDADGSKYIELEEFTVYRPSHRVKRAMEMCTLDRLQVEKGVDELCFSGTLLTSKDMYYVQDVKFSVLAIDGYDDTTCASTHGKVCIQSQWARLHDIWYRLGRPSTEYKGFYNDFVWLATFTKFFVDFLLDREDDVTLHRFRSEFASWIKHRYGQDQVFRDWHRKCGYKRDFGASAAAYVAYLYKECYSIDDSTPNLLRHSLWGEIDPANLSAIKRQPSDPSQATVVTPFAFRCFKDMYFGAHLERQVPTLEVEAQISKRKQDLCLTPWNAAHVSRPHDSHFKSPDQVQVGDVVCMPSHANRQWKLSITERWFACVSNVRQDRWGSTLLDVLWLYEPSDTTLGNAYYPFQNELFLSDNCACGKDAIPLEAIDSKVDVSWFVKDPHTVDGWFVRQKFETVEAEDSYGFVTLSDKDFSCHDSHRSEFDSCVNHYRVGQSVLARPPRQKHQEALLQPMRIVSFDTKDQRIVLRTFCRASWTDNTAPPNELFESAEQVALKADRVIRTCEIGQFLNREDASPRFKRDGLADCFYIIASNEFGSSQTALQTPPDSDHDDVVVGSDGSCFGAAECPLPGLDLYCGGGNFGRGLEEAGIVKMRYAVDWDAPALHSYRANTDNPADIQYYLGSVNDYLRQALSGSPLVEVAPIGSIEFTSAGSPCPGFSRMQPSKESDQSLQYASMVASVVAFVDTWSPRYFILENVVPMTNRIVRDGREQNVFSQVLAALAALGYQVQQFLGDAWLTGSSQSRSRVFIVASAPGTVPLRPLPSTHGHPPKKGLRQNLGRTTNGLPFGVRRFEETPFPYVSAESSTRDLPDIGDSLTQICPQFPDHRTHTDQSQFTRQLIAQVPTYPRGTGIIQAVRDGMVTSGEAFDWAERCITSDGIRGKADSSSYSRIRPDGLFPTILTALHLQCGKNGSVLHWEQHRSLSVMETRRAQNFLDHEVIVGAPSQQLKIVGNSVDRKVAFSIGTRIRNSWENTLRSRRTLARDVAEVVDLVSDANVTHTVGPVGNFPRPSPVQTRQAIREKNRTYFATHLRRVRSSSYDSPDDHQGWLSALAGDDASQAEPGASESLSPKPAHCAPIPGSLQSAITRNPSSDVSRKDRQGFEAAGKTISVLHPQERLNGHHADTLAVSGGQRWTGRSEEDAAAIGRYEAELDIVLRINGL